MTLYPLSYGTLRHRRESNPRPITITLRPVPKASPMRSRETRALHHRNLCQEAVRVKQKLYFTFSILYITLIMISSAQIRAARVLLKWTQAMLAHRAAISIVTLNMIESDRVDPRASTLRAIAAALEMAGVDFIGSEREGLGVRLRPRRRS